MRSIHTRPIHSCIHKLILFCWLDYLYLGGVLRLHWRHLAWKTPRNQLFYRQTTVGIWQQDSTYQCPWWQPPIPPALSKFLEQIQQAFQLTPLLAEGYLSLDSHKGPSYKHLSTSRATQLLFSHHVFFGPIFLALPPLICLHLSSNLSAACIHSQNMAA